MNRVELRRLVAAILFCIFAGSLVVLIGTSTALRFRAPAVALSVWPWNGEARGALAARAVLNGNYAEGRRLAAQALSQVPGDVVSLRALGVAQPPAETNRLALRVMQLATRASRRDLLTNLWFIEYNVGRGDIAGAVQYYDYSLKSSADSERLLFPVLVPAMTSPEVAAAVRSKLLSRPIWMTSFLQYAFASGAADGQLIGVVLSLAHDRIGLSMDLKRQYAQRLAERGNYAGLDRLARGLGRPLVAGTAELDNLAGLPPVDWRLLSGQGLSTFTDPVSGIGFVASQNGALAERILRLSPGSYALELAPTFEDGGGNARLLWSMICLPDGRQIAVVPVANRGQLVVPPERCLYQKLSLAIESERFADGIEVSGRAARMRVARVGSM